MIDLTRWRMGRRMAKKREGELVIKVEAFEVKEKND